MRQLAMLPPPSVPRCLAVTLSAREVGYAVVSQRTLVRHGVLNLRKIPSGDGRERRFAQVATALFDAHAPTAVAVVELPFASDAAGALLKAERSWIERLAEERRLRLSAHRAGDVRAAIAGQEPRRSHRSLADVLVRRFPEVWTGTLAATPPNRPHHVAESEFAPRARPRTNREAYWRNAFLAIGAALLMLDNPPNSYDRPKDSTDQGGPAHLPRL